MSLFTLFLFQFEICAKLLSQEVLTKVDVSDNDLYLKVTSQLTYQKY